MYGLKQARILAYEKLVKNLQLYWYKPITHNICLWKYYTKPITSCLCVDDSIIKYFIKSDVNHLLQYLQKSYTKTVYWPGKTFCGITLDWKYQNLYVNMSMSGYVQKSLQKF